MSKIASFDLEIYKSIPQGTRWQDISPLGISCAACWLDGHNAEIFHELPEPFLSRKAAIELVTYLSLLTNSGYTLVTWDGCGFDFPVLAEESGLLTECSNLALNHVDLMLLVTFIKGYYLGLNRACIGMGLIPEMWRNEEYPAVITYLKGDVEQTNLLAHAIENEKCLRWTSNSGNLQVLNVEHLYTVRDLLDYPLPDTSWMTNPVSRDSFLDWMRF